VALPHRLARGRQGAPEQVSASAARQGSCCTIPMATVTMEGPSPASPRQRPRDWQSLPTRRNPSPELAPGVCWGRGQRRRGRAIGSLRCTRALRTPTLRPPTTDEKTDGRTHLGTAHVSLTARAGFPWSMGFLKSVRSSSKAMIWGRGVWPSGLEEQLPVSRTHPSMG
jgi:hypothetical protein